MQQLLDNEILFIKMRWLQLIVIKFLEMKVIETLLFKLGSN